MAKDTRPTLWAYGTASSKIIRKQIKHRKLMQRGILKPLSKDELRKLGETLTLKKHNDGST